MTTMTAEAALSTGWTWLAVRCPNCRRKTDIALTAIVAAEANAPLMRYAARLRCKTCVLKAVDLRLAKGDDGRGAWRTEVVILSDD